MNLLSTLFVFVGITLRSCLSAGDGNNQNLLHFHGPAGWQGPPTALHYRDGVLRLYYEQPVDISQASSSAQMKWAQASTTDGLNWKDEDPFVKETPKSSCKGASYHQGGMIDWIYSTEEKKSLAAIHQRCPDGKSSILGRFTTDGINSIEAKNEPLLEGAVGSDVFLSSGKLYLASINDTNCNIACHVIDENLQTRFELRYNIKSPIWSGVCRGLQVHQLEYNMHIFSLSSYRDRSVSQTLYFTGRFGLALKGPYVLDDGLDAQDFKFAFFNDTTVAIGWNGNQAYPDSFPNSMTTPRYIKATENGRLAQEPFSFADKAIKSGIKVTEDDLPLKTESCYKSIDLSLIEPTRQGAFIFDLEFTNGDDFKTDGFLIKFQSIAEQTTDEIVVAFYHEDVGSTDNYKLTVDRSGTDTSWGPKSNLAVADLGHLSSIKTVRLNIILDYSTIEVFAFNGTTAMTVSYRLKNKNPRPKVCISSIHNELNVILTKNSSYGKYAGMTYPNRPNKVPSSGLPYPNRPNKVPSSTQALSSCGALYLSLLVGLLSSFLF